MSRHQFLFAIVLSAAGCVPLLASDFSADRYPATGASQADLPSYTGRLKRNDADRDGSAPYILVDKWGAIQSYVRPETGLQLAPYVGRQVWIQGASTPPRRDGLRCLKADEVSLANRPAAATGPAAPYRGANSPTNRPYRLAQPDSAMRQTAFEEPAANPPGEPVPAPQPVPSATPNQHTPFVPEHAVASPQGYIPDGDGPGPMDDAAPGCACDTRGGPCDGPCGPTCGSCCTRCCSPAAAYWAHVDYLMWWTKGMETPPLVTTDTLPITTGAGGLGNPGTVVVFGGDRILNGMQSGGRLQGGLWLNDCDSVGIDGEFMALGGDDVHWSLWSPGVPTLFRPFFDTSTGQNRAEEVAVPNSIAGTVSVDARTSFESAQANLRIMLGCCQNCCSCGWRTDLLLGYRHLDLRDRLGVTEDLTSLVSASTDAVASTSFQVHDQFDTENQFNGGQIGLMFKTHRGPWSLEMTPKIALGDTHEIASINGSTLTFNAAGVPTAAVGGLLAQGTNIGNYSRDEFAVAPQFDATIGYQLTRHLQATFGYSFLYWSRVARAGDQININVDSRNIPPVEAGAGTQPSFNFNSASFWAQGLNFGLTYQW